MSKKVLYLDIYSRLVLRSLFFKLVACLILEYAAVDLTRLIAQTAGIVDV